MRIALPLLGLALPLAALATLPAHSAPPSAPQPAAFGRCAVCHGVEQGEPAEVGPNLWGVAGAKAGSRPGYAYSAALKKSGIVWKKATLTRWLVNDQQVAPGTTMPNQAVPPADREAIVRYLMTLK